LFTFTQVDSYVLSLIIKPELSYHVNHLATIQEFFQGVKIFNFSVTFDSHVVGLLTYIANWEPR